MHAATAEAAPVTYLKVTQVAARLNVSVRHVQYLISQGELIGVWVGARTLRVRAEDFDAYERKILADARAAAEAASRQ